MSTRTAIVGLGVTGLSCVRYLHGVDELVVVDTRARPPGLEALRSEFPGVEVRLEAARLAPAGLDRVLVSPGVGLDDPLLADLPGDLPRISDIDLFCAAADAPVIAVTGTNGKSTVTSLVGHLLNRAGMKAVVGGNLGEPALELLDDEAEAYVLELSSFQLERLAPQRFLAATILNLSEDHLDRHPDPADYRAAKQRIYRDCAVAVANRADRATYPTAPTDAVLTSFGADPPETGHWGVRVVRGSRWLARGCERLLQSADLPLAGRHNEQNVLAALALASATQARLPDLVAALGSFRSLPHRCEKVGTRGGVEFVNDSKATNVGATLAALAGLAADGSRRIILIAGGDGKGADFAPLVEPVAAAVKAVVLLGRDAPELARLLASVVPVHRVQDMSAAVELSAELAEPGDLVLLSPACASLDMYRNFAARGDAFAGAVAELAA